MYAWQLLNKRRGFSPIRRLFPEQSPNVHLPPMAGRSSISVVGLLKFSGEILIFSAITDRMNMLALGFRSFY